MSDGNTVYSVGTVNVVKFLFASFFLSQFLYVYSGDIIFQLLNMLIGVLSFFYIYPYVSRYGWGYIILVTIFATLTTLLSLKFKFGDIIFAATMPFFAILLNLFRRELKWPALCFCILTICYCGYAIVMGWDLNTQLFQSSSRNYISVLCIFSFYCVVISSAQNTIKIILLILVSIIILYSNSRSAFISFSIVLLFYILKISSIFKKTSIVILLVMLAILPLLIINHFTEIYNYLYDSLGIVRRLSVGELSDTGRFDVIKCYYEKLDPLSILLGLDYLSNNQCSFLANGTDNPHNSFIRLFSNLGFFSFIIIILLFWSLLRTVLKKNYLVLSLMLCFILRGGTDILFFFQTWDAYLYSIIFISLPEVFFNMKGQDRIKLINFWNN
ncbi:hypothetical protein [Citrobacter amalonaticus]|uniref:hypothetical protein n=2 Tax=Citrobacter amalonaticus TaxID=35703 RepID=UPI001240D0FB|nr:hypothetical protein [Citrobacter amalonaticus]